jgi:hypothetical protein
MACRDIAYKNGPQGVGCDNHITLFDNQGADDRAKLFCSAGTPVVEALICAELPAEDDFTAESA